MANFGTFRKNKYSDIIIPVIEHFNRSRNRVNPFELLIAHAVLTARTEAWGNNIAGYSFETRTKTRDAYLKAGTFATDMISIYKREAALANLPNPMTSVMATLTRRVQYIDFGNSNAWADWVAAVSYFRAAMLNLLVETVTPKYLKYYQDASKMFVHPNSTVNGLSFDAAARVGNDLQTFSIDFKDATPAGLKNKFFTFTDSIGTIYAVKFQLDGDDTFDISTQTSYDVLGVVAITSQDTVSSIIKKIGNLFETFPTVSDSVLGTIFSVEFTVVSPLNIYEVGTAGIGVNYQIYGDLIASDDTILASRISDVVEYAARHNELRIPYEKSLGVDLHYLEPVHDGFGYNFYAYAANPNPRYNTTGTSTDLILKATRDAYLRAANETAKVTTDTCIEDAIACGGVSVIS